MDIPGNSPSSSKLPEHQAEEKAKGKKRGRTISRDVETLESEEGMSSSKKIKPTAKSHEEKKKQWRISEEKRQVRKRKQVEQMEHSLQQEALQNKDLLEENKKLREKLKQALEENKALKEKLASSFLKKE